VSTEEVGFKRKLALLAAFGLIGFSLACTASRSTALGFLVDVASAPTSCGDGRDIVAIAMGNGRAMLNAETYESLDQLALRLHEVMSYRAEKLVYVAADPQTSWADFLGMVSRVWPEADVVSLITPKVEQLARKRYCLVPSCGRCDELRSRRIK
jgi:hypothetical protein